MGNCGVIAVFTNESWAKIVPAESNGSLNRTSFNKTELATKGYSVVPNAVTPCEVDRFRGLVLGNQQLMKNTRPTPSARHLAGFHRFEAFAELHARLASNESVARALDETFDGDIYEDIGLTDITINRSQQWHSDLAQLNS